MHGTRVEGPHVAVLQLLTYERNRRHRRRDRLRMGLEHHPIDHQPDAETADDAAADR